MKLNEVKRRTGLKHSTIRVYEDRGLVTPDTAERNGRLYREYSEEDVARLEVVSGLRKALFSIEQIKLMLEDPELIPALLVSHRKKVDALAEELEQLKASLDAIDTPPKSAAELNARLSETAVRQMPLPQADVHPRFRYLDELYPPTGREDARKLRLPPKVKFFTKTYFVVLPLILLMAVLLSRAFLRGSLGRRTIDVSHWGETLRFVCEDQTEEGETHTWTFREIGSKYSAVGPLAYLTMEKNAGGTIWTLRELRSYARDPELDLFGEALGQTERPTSPETSETVIVRTDEIDGSTYTYNGREQHSTSESARMIDEFIAGALAMDAPVTGKEIGRAILSGLLVVALGHLLYCGGRVYISLRLYWVRFTKMANAGYEAANFIEDTEHLYGPAENDIDLFPAERKDNRVE